jgi:hypothetical protein
MTIPWVLVLLRYIPSGRIMDLRNRMGWTGKRWQQVRDTHHPWNDPQVLAEMSSGLGWNASALIPEFVRQEAVMMAARVAQYARIDEAIARNDPAVLEQIAQLKADARARPKRKR